MKATEKKSRIELYVIISAVLLLIAAFSTFIFIKTRPHKKTAAFYGLSRTVAEALQQQIEEITRNDERPFNFVVLDENQELEFDAVKDFDLLFTADGLHVEQLKANALAFDEKLYNAMPSALRDTSLKAMPVLLDHYEASFYLTLSKRLGLAVPSDYDGMKSFLLTEKPEIQYASLCAGRNDSELYGFISNLVLSLYGYDRYMALCRQISESGGEVIPEDLKSILNEVKNWQYEGLIMPNWYEASVQDITSFFVPERTAGTVFMSLSVHRQIESMYMKYFETKRFPVKKNIAVEALVAPKICALTFHDEAGAAGKIMAALLSPDVQEYLSDKTLLAPCSSTSYAHDIQSDDVRFFAASSKNGPVPHIGLAALSNPGQRAALASAIRDYLKRSDFKKQ